MSGSVPLRHVYAFMDWTGTTLLLSWKILQQKAAFEVPTNYVTHIHRNGCCAFPSNHYFYITLFLYRCISRSRYLGLNITVSL